MRQIAQILCRRIVAQIRFCNFASTSTTVPLALATVTLHSPNIAIRDAAQWPVDLLADAKRETTVVDDFVTAAEETLIVDEVHVRLKRLRYETAHWDDAIHNYRETERSTWSAEVQPIIDRIRAKAMPPSTTNIPHVHILDLHKDGVIKPHVDAVRYCGDVIAGVSLLSPAVMRFRHCTQKQCIVDVHLPRRSLYIIRGCMRYDFTHEVLHNDEAFFDGEHIVKGRRISIVCRDVPKAANESAEKLDYKPIQLGGD